MAWNRNEGRGARLIGMMALAGTALAAPASAQFARRDLISDQVGKAEQVDADLTNAWGVAFNPTGFVWVGDNHSGKSTLYDGNGIKNSLVVNIPSPALGTGGAATGIRFYGGSNFKVGTGAGAAPARFIFAGEDGVISAWAPSVPNPPPSTQAQRAVDNSGAKAIYKGLALGSVNGNDRLFAADFHNARIDSFDGNFAPVAGAFTDPNLPAGYAPFNMRVVGDRVFVTYAQQDAEGEDDVPGAGHGFINTFDLSGNLLGRFASQGALNSPWGMAVAPADFGAFAGALLVGNFGDGTINAFNLTTGVLLGTLQDSGGQALHIDGLWGIEFGNGLNNQPLNTLFFAAGPEDEQHGLYGRIDVPGPGAMGLGAIAALAGLRRRR